MKKKNKIQFILALTMLFAFACNNSDKKEESTETKTDTTTATTETAQPVPQDATPDAVKAAPDLYKVLGDSAGIRIVEATYKPGDSSVLHSHADYAVYATSGGSVTFYGKDGSKAVSEMKMGTAYVRPAEVHSVKNTGKTPVKVILVEVSRPAQIIPIDAATDATKVASDVYKEKADSLGIRVLEVTAKPGKSIAMHSHPDAALYMLEGGTVEFTHKDGSKQVRELPKGVAAVLPAESHSAKNTGKTTFKAILVEVNRAK
jgi:quercetin dioxygenase-like cupin family protein